MTDLIVDANSLYARSWYAAQKIGPNPEQTLRLAAVTVLNLLNPVTSEIGVSFNRTLFCWDSGNNAAKRREPRPQEYYDMRSIAKELFTLLLGAANAEVEPFEGDDLVASAVYDAEPGTSVVIASGDKDLMQLVDNKKGVAYYSLNDKCVLSEYTVCNKFHVKQPCQIALALAIQGDSVDCISGVRGWGKEKVKKLFKPVQKGMTFEEVIGILENSMNPEQRQQFYEALERTLLSTRVQLPRPAPLVFAEDDAIAVLEMPEILNRLREVRYLYDENSGHDFQ
jgi:5'-3' exonuclease